MAVGFTEGELLLPFEQARLRRGYREFYKAKRKHFFTTIGYFNELWDAFQMLDEVWDREIQDVSRPAAPIQILPAQMLILSHGRLRIAGELAFSGCVGDAWSIIRASIELAVHARRILSKPELAKVWLNREDGDAEKKAFKKEFWYEKKERAFAGMSRLLEYWQICSEWGSHSNVAVVAMRTRSQEAAEGSRIEVSYMEGDASRMAHSLHLLLDAGWETENVFFQAFEDRLKLDVSLLEMRSRFAKRHDDLREAILKMYGQNSTGPK